MRFGWMLAALAAVFVQVQPAWAVTTDQSFQTLASFSDVSPSYQGDGYASAVWLGNDKQGSSSPEHLIMNLQFRTVAGGSDYVGSIICCDGGTEAIRFDVTGNNPHGANPWQSFFDLTSSSTYTPEFLATFGGDALAAKNALYTGLLATDADFRLRSLSNPAFDAVGSFNQIKLGAIPEPSTWAMMMFGIGVVGAAMRRRQGRNLVTMIA